MEYLLIKFGANWADEFDLEGFLACDKETWDNIVEGMPDKPCQHYFGSNEFIEFRNRADQLSNFEVSPITKEHFRMLHQLFDKYYDPEDPELGSLTFGNFEVRSENW